MSVESEIQKLAPSAIVELFVLDATALGGGVTRFHAGTNSLTSTVVWAGNSYAAMPIQADGFEFNGRGQLPRPKIRVANVTGILSALVRDYQDLLGATVTRKRTMVKFLDAVNFPGGVNPDADPTAAFPDDVFSVDRKAIENKTLIEFELSAAFDVAGVMLPRRQIVQNVCPWQYRSSECSYAGGAVAKADDTLTSSLDLDACGKRLTSCKLRFGEYGILPYGGFPAAGLIR